MEKIPVRTLHTTAATAHPGSFCIRQISALTGGQDMIQELHRHDFYFMLVILKGSGIHEIDFTHYMVSAKSVFLMRPGQVHRLHLHAATTGYLLQFPASFYYPDQQPARLRLRQSAAVNAYHCASRHWPPLQYALDTIWQEYNNRGEDYEEMIKVQLSVFFTGLNRMQERACRPGNDYRQEQLESFLHLLETHISTHKQVGQYAAMLHLSAYQLSAITQTTLGKTPSALIREQVILEAKRLLLATSRQVTQVADELGYEDVSYFVRLFRKHTGYTPEVFRRLDRG